MCSLRNLRGKSLEECIQILLVISVALLVQAKLIHVIFSVGIRDVVKRLETWRSDVMSTVLKIGWKLASSWWHRPRPVRRRHLPRTGLEVSGCDVSLDFLLLQRAGEGDSWRDEVDVNSDVLW